MRRKFQILEMLEPFNRLEKAVLTSLCAESSVRRFSERALIAKAGSPLPYLAIVISGQLQQLYERADGTNIIIGQTNQLQSIGWLWAIDNNGVPYSLYAQPGAEIFFIPISSIRKLLAIPAVSHFANRELARSLRQQFLERALQSISNVHDRVYAQIWILCSQNSTDETTSLPKQHELAQMVNTSRETVSRALQALLKQGILIKKGNQFVINQPEQLRKFTAFNEISN